MFDNGIFHARSVMSRVQIERLKEAFFLSLEKCEQKRKELGHGSSMQNTVHHVLFDDPIFSEVITSDQNWNIVSDFFKGKFILNSIGGNNNKGGNSNYASEIHRDVRFFTQERFMLNSILCVSSINQSSGATEFFLNKGRNAKRIEDLCDDQPYILSADPGDIFYFDSRIWHRAGEPQRKVEERIIFTPIYSRPFVKPGYDYCRVLKDKDLSGVSCRLKQLCGYYSDIPSTLDEWYGSESRRFYQKEQDEW